MKEGIENISANLRHHRIPMLMVKKAKHILILWLLGSMILPGCITKMTIYGFKSSKVTYDWGQVGARLLGKKTETTFTFTSKSPYELILWFHSDEFSDGMVEILEIRLDKAKGIILDQNERIILPFEQEEKGVSAYYSVKNLNMDHENATLQIDFRLPGLSDPRPLSATIEFKTDFKEYYMLKPH